MVTKQIYTYEGDKLEPLSHNSSWYHKTYSGMPLYNHAALTTVIMMLFFWPKQNILLALYSFKPH